MSSRARRKERSISSSIVSTPRVSAQNRTTGKRTRTVMRNDLLGNGSLPERTLTKEESPFHEVLLGREPEDLVAFGEDCSFKALSVPDHLAHENRVLRHKFSKVSDALMAANEKLLNLSVERNSAYVSIGQMEELKSLLAAQDGELEAMGKESEAKQKMIEAKQKMVEAKDKMLEAKEKMLEARSLLVRAREDEIRGLRAKIESLLRERDEAVCKELQECKSKEDGSSASEELEHMRWKFAELEKDMERAVIAARITTRYQVCREWERQGTLRCELEFSKEDYLKFREHVDKNGMGNKYPLVEVYEENWKNFVARHRPSESLPYSDWL